MLYVQVILEMPRHKVREALEAYGREAYPREKVHLQQVGGRLIGCWFTEYGRQGEVTFIWAFPNHEARERMMELSKQDTELSRWNTEVWQAQYANFATTKTMRLAPFSPQP